jgi:type IV pilus assembly protein PilN
MRIPINLATEPFEPRRPILAGFVVASAVLLGLLVLQIALIYGERSRLAESRQQVEALNRQLQTLAAEQARFDAALRIPENAEVLERNQLINQLIERKSISWTRIFADLEQVMPGNVRLITVRLPQVNEKNEVLLDMVVGAQSPEPVLGLLRRLEQSPLFGPTTVHSSLPPSQNEPLYRYRVSVNYARKPA